MNTVLNSSPLPEAWFIRPVVVAALAALEAFGPLSSEQAATLLGGWSRRDEMTDAEAIAVAATFCGCCDGGPSPTVVIGGLLRRLWQAGRGVTNDELEALARELGVTLEYLADAFLDWASWYVRRER